MKVTYGFLFDYAILIIITIVIAFFSGLEFSWIIAIFLGLIILHSYASFQTISAQELGGILFFGAFVRKVNPGWELVPVFSCKLVKATGLTIQRQFPDETENIEKTGNNVPAPGKKFPIRVAHRQIDGSQDPLEKRLTSETTGFVRYKIEEFKIFYTTIGSEEEAEKQMRDTFESQIRMELAKRTVAETLTSLPEINGIIKIALDTLVHSWGIAISEASIIEVGFSHGLNSSMSAAVEEQFKQKAVILKAEGEMQRLTLEGKGMAKAEELFLKAQAVGYKKIATELEIEEKELVLKMQMMKESFEKANYSIIPGGDAISFAAGLSEILKKINK